jgi:hypothetical protein
MTAILSNDKSAQPGMTVLLGAARDGGAGLSYDDDIEQ